LEGVEEEAMKRLWWWEVNSWSGPASIAPVVGREGDEGRLSLVDAMDGAWIDGGEEGRRRKKAHWPAAEIGFGVGKKLY
jgi:hypothetical protein